MFLGTTSAGDASAFISGRCTAEGTLIRSHRLEALSKFPAGSLSAPSFQFLVSSPCLAQSDRGGSYRLSHASVHPHPSAGHHNMCVGGRSEKERASVGKHTHTRVRHDDYASLQRTNDGPRGGEGSQQMGKPAERLSYPLSRSLASFGVSGTAIPCHFCQRTGDDQLSG